MDKTAAKYEDIRLRFRRIAEERPEAVAIRGGGREIPYGRLLADVGRIRDALRIEGVGRGGVVSLYGDSSPELIAALLGVLETGGAFLPLDPRLPAGRLAAMVGLAEPAVLLVAPGAPEPPPEAAGPARRLDLATILAGSCAPAPSDLMPGEPDDMIYLYFTSGSTGRPKGIAGRRKGLDHFIDWEIGVLGVEPGWRVSQLTSPAFDAYLRDVFVPLCAGGTVCLPADRETVADARELVAWLDREEIRVLHCVPSLFRTLVQQDLHAALFPNLRFVLLAGEPLLGADVRAWRDVFEDRVQLVNLYGPTETTMVKLARFVRPEDAEQRVVPIGKPMPGARALVVDARGEICAPRAVGEILIRTPYRTLGYFRQPDLTAAAFVQNPFNPNPNDLVYRTGDLGRILEDGTFEFVGRRDHQVKVRGVRVELLEIERLLLEHPQVREAAVVDLEDAGGLKFLCAYVVVAAETGLEPLRDHLAARLPAALLPSVFIPLESLPRTLSGKVDRLALPAPEADRAAAAGFSLLPATPVEARLAQTFAAVLGLERVGVDADFFRLGGHSLLSTHLLSRLRTVFGIEVPLRALFEKPTVAGLVPVVEELLACRAGLTTPPLAPAARDGDLPLSFAQQRLWLLDQLQPGGTAYHLSFALSLAGPLDADVLTRALDGVRKRHEVLRTTFTERSGRPVQEIHPPVPEPLPVVDLRDLPADERGEEALRCAAAEARRPFDLKRGPLFRASLLRLAEDEHCLVAVQHHIVSDAWSIALLVREVGALYEEERGGVPAALPVLPVQYADFAVWQRGWLRGELLERHLTFWRRELEDAPLCLEMPVDRPRPAVAGRRGGRLPLRLSPALTGSLEELGRRGGATQFMVLLAAFQTLLGRFAAVEDLVVGVPVAGRNRAELERLVGLFVNSLALRADLAGDPRFQELLERVRERALETYVHQDLPFERLVEELGITRNLDRAPVFQVLLALQTVPATAPRLAGVKVEPLEVFNGGAKLDLEIRLEPRDDALRGVLEYRSDLFDATTAARLAARFEILLRSAVTTPSAHLSELSWLPEAERQQIAWEWNDTAAVLAEEGWLPDRIEARMAGEPGALAVVSAEGRLTYGELDRRSAGLAHRLRALGANRGTVVGVCLERSADLVVALLGVLRAGAAYLPLEPGDPDERLETLLRDAGATFVVTHGELRWRLAVPGVRTVCLEVESGETPPDRVPQRSLAGEDLAYVIFTSGSTGRPKGVANTHRGIRNRLLWMQEVYRLTPQDRVLQKTPAGFDVSVWELFWPLLAGASLVVARPEGHRDPAYLVDLMAAEGVTTCHFVPSMLEVFLERPDIGRCASLRRVVCSGEALPAALRDRFFACLGSAGLHNLYGPTEAAVDVSFHSCQPGVPRDFVPIGRPISNLLLVVADDGLRLLPTGVPGELVISGEGLARGYVGRPDLTAERFVPDPVGAPGDRLYRTGDRAQLLPDGTLRYLGRLDHQVKLRGVRIEPGEIEAVLALHPGVREATVALRPGPAGKPQLVAWWTAAGKPAPDAAELRAHLRRSLPEALVPASLILLDAMPVTANGKLDRAALPAPAAAVPEATGARALSPCAEMLAGIWSGLLGIAPTGPEDSFFDLGGHSLLATQMLSRVRDTFGVELPLGCVFAQPTLAGLAAEIDRARREEMAGEPVPPLVPSSPDARAPLCFAQRRLWMLQHIEPESVAYNMVRALRLEGELDVAALRAALDGIVRRHAVLRTTFPLEGDLPVQVIALRLDLPAPMIDLGALPAARRAAEEERLCSSIAQAPFDLARGPLLRFLLLRLAEEDHVAALALHHIVSDGWSMGIVFREIMALYAAFAERRPSPLPELPVQYADFAVWQHAWLHGEVLEREISYWRRHLAGLPPLLELPTDRPRAVRPSFRGARRPVRLPAGLTRPLQGVSRREGVTLFMALLAGFQVLLARWSGQDDLAVGTPVAGRNRVEVEGLIGFFVNTLVLRGDLSGDPDFPALLGRTREVALAAYVHQDLPFEKLVEELAPVRDRSRTPLFQVMFTLQEDAARGGQAMPELSGLTAEWLEVAVEATKFDLTLALARSEDGGLAGTIEYAMDLFDAATVARLAGQLETLLTEIAAAPGRRLAELPLLTAAERHQLDVEWNAAPSPGTEDGATLLERFTAQAERTPDRVAVVDGYVRLTYGELAARSERVGSRLRCDAAGRESGAGSGPSLRVGLSLERSPEMIVGLLGILGAGGAYVPIDPTYPPERQDLMLRDAGLTGVVNGEWLAANGGEDAGASGAAPGTPPSWIASHRSGKHAPFYLIYTSGSTGQPKGAEVREGAFAVLVDWYVDELGIDATDRVLLLSSASFDLTQKNFFAPLLAGAELHLAPSVYDPAQLRTLVERNGITHLNCTPSAFYPLLEEGDPAALASLRTVVLGGEPIAAGRLARWRLSPTCRAEVINSYGPTECTDVVAFHRLAPPDGPPPFASIPLGRPVPGVRLRIVSTLAAAREPAPIGVAGELWIGGECVGGGYVGDPARTAEKFLPDPFSESPGARAYRTGDLARRLPGGEVDYLGRIDHQVKVRGVRIELGEIEAALAAQTGVREAVVVAREIHPDRPGDLRLVAYVVPADSDAGVAITKLSAALARRLPQSMLPAAYVALAALPLTPSGKVDRRALPEPGVERGGRAPWVEPRTRAERELAKVWQSLLGVEKVGIDDNFFSLGGDSILGIQMAARVARAGLRMRPGQVFTHQTLGALASVVEEAEAAPPPEAIQGLLLSEFEREILARLPREMEDLYPLSPLQQGMLAHSLRDTGAYFLQLSCVLKGDLDRAAFADAWQRVVDRHTALRTAFVWEGLERPLQAVYREVRVPLVEEDWRGSPAAAQEALLQDLLLRQRREGFDLAQPPLLRLTLARLDDRVWRLVWSFHHLLVDGWSTPLLVREVFARYAAERRGEAGPAGPAPAFRAYIDWLGGRDPSAAEAFWRNELSGFRTPTPLPARSAGGESLPGQRGLTLHPARTEALRGLARRLGTTPNTLVQGAWALLLGRTSGEPDVVFGVVSAGRPPELPGVEEAVGLFINTLPLRVRLDEQAPLAEWLCRLQERQAAVREHEHTPLAEVQRWSEIPRGTPLFDSLLVFENYPVGEVLSGLRSGLEIRDALDLESTEYGLNLVAALGERLSLRLIFDHGCFDGVAVARVLRGLEALLGSMAEAPGARLGDLAWLQEAERQQVLVEWSDTAVAAPLSLCVHELFAIQARERPGAVAMVCGEEKMLYGELDRRSDLLARLLWRRGVGPEARVALCAGRSPALVTAMLAVLKAGAAYVPLDPELPAERLTLLLREADVCLALAAAGDLGRLASAASGLPISWLDLDAVGEEGEVGERLAPTAGPASLAYLMYTSGSTGVPKGVAVPHQAIVRLVWETGYARFGAEEVFLHLAPPMFDASTFEIWGALLHGARLVILPAPAPSLAALGATLERHGVTTLWLTAGLFHAVVDEAVERLAPVRQLLAGGEALSAPHVRQALAAAPGRRLINGYGPTESTTFACCWSVTDPEEVGSAVSIGRPIANTRVHLLDRSWCPVGIGTAAELCIGGAGLARGYWRRPDLTAERFVPAPIGFHGDRLYRTGDLACWRPDGTLEFLGRIDRQLKVRGFRVEPGEVEAALVRHPGVLQAAVVGREGEAGQQRLVAYVVFAREATAIAELEEHLRRSLPEYMVPADFVPLEALPLTANGKVDRRALPEPGRNAEAERPWAAPRTRPERILAEIWQALLRVERVGLEDGFFALGGDSILALQVVSRAARAGLRVSAAQIFLHPTLGELAAVAGMMEEVAAWEGASSGPVELTPIQRWFFARDLPDPNYWNQAVLLRLRRAVKPGHLARALELVAPQHEALRLRFERRPDGWIQELADGWGPSCFSRVDLAALPLPRRSEVQAAVAAAVQGSLDLGRGPLSRTVLLGPAADGGERLLWVIHHLVVDGISWRVLLEDLEAVCAQLARGDAPALPAVTTPFREWARRLSGYARSGSLDREAGYWLAQAAVEALPLQVDAPGGANTVATVEQVTVELGEEETRALLQEAHQAYRTRIDDLLLTALAEALEGWSGPGPLRIHLEGHGREDRFTGVDLSRTAGWFTSIYPVLLDLPASASPGARIRAVKGALRRVPGAGLGYGLLRYLCEGEAAERLRAAPGAEVSFNYLGQLDPVVAERGLFAVAEEGPGPSQSGRQPRAHLLEIDGGVLGGRLRMIWKYSRELHRRATVERVADEFLGSLRRLIAHCSTKDAGGFIPADFPLAGLSQERLDALLGAGRQVEDLYPLSPLQQGMLFHSLREEGLYSLQLSSTLEGDLDPKRFERAWQGVVDRHTALRTGFLWKDLEDPLQMVHRRVPVRVEVHDWSTAAASVQALRWEDLLAADRGRGFDLSRPPLLRLVLARWSERVWRFLWSFHHLLVDGWSMPLLVREVLDRYETLARGETLVLPPPPPYRRHIAWLAGREAREAEEVWRRELAGFHAPTPLPARCASGCAAGVRELALGAQATVYLRAFARRHDLTLNTLLQGAWALLLSRTCGETDVVFGVVSSGRPLELPGADQAVGMFINTLPLRARVEDGKPLVAWLAALQERQATLRVHEQTPLADIQGWSEVPRGTPLFDSLVVFENYPVEALTRTPGKIGVRDVVLPEVTNYPLTVTALPGERLLLRICHRAGFAAAEIDLLVGRLAMLLERMAEDRGISLGDLDPLTTGERHQLLREWNDTAEAFAMDGGCCLHELIEDQVERAPERIAAVYEGESLTYRELERRADRLAGRLTSLGVGPEFLVAVCAERSLELVVGLLAILKAGAAYLPLDPGYPEDRLAFMMRDSGVAVVLTQDRLAGRLAGAGRMRVVVLGEAEGWEGGRSRRTVEPASAAYVIYTSGSTGRPKGVVNTHRGIVNRLLWMQSAYRLAEDDRVLQKTPYGFDVSVWEFFWPLLVGARLILARPGGHLDSGYLARTIAYEGITTVHFVPSMLQGLLDDPDLALCGGLRRVLVSGEALTPALQQRFHGLLGAELHNLYGPTEAAVDVTAWASAPEEAGSRVSIGRPVANTQIHLLSQDLRPLPLGRTGELCIGGVQVARGYHARPDLTAERFVPDPFAEGGEAGARLYRTGDLVRYRPDGLLEYLGRADHQVKLRGQRIELGEVEAVLTEHRGVSAAVVTAVEGLSGEGVLAAYIVGSTRSEGELRAFLTERLPAAMIPGVFVFLESLPLTSNGKVDRRALPAPAAGCGLKRPYVPPQTPTEEALAAIWIELLRVEQVGIHDEFHTLGGQSLTAMRLLSRIRATFGVDLPLGEALDDPTVAALAKKIDDLQLDRAGQRAAPELDCLLSYIEGLSETEVDILMTQEAEGAL